MRTTITSTDIEASRGFAIAAHFGQRDKNHQPYIEHVARVAHLVKDCSRCETLAWLHDVQEDAEHLRILNHVDEDLRKRILLLTRKPEEDSVIYYQNIRKDFIALRVKLADIIDNTSEERLATLDEKTRTRLSHKYARAIRALTG